MAGFMQEDIDRYANTMTGDRGLGTPAPASPAAAPSAPTRDWDGNTNSFVNRSLISPELQGIIDKVTSSSSSMSPRQRSDIAHLAGVVGGLQQNRMTEQGQMARLGVTEGSQANRFAATNALAQGQLGVHQGQLGVQQEDLALKKKAAPAALQSMISGGVGASDSKPKPWHSDYPDLMNYFK